MSCTKDTFVTSQAIGALLTVTRKFQNDHKWSRSTLKYSSIRISKLSVYIQPSSQDFQIFCFQICMIQLFLPFPRMSMNSSGISVLNHRTFPRRGKSSKLKQTIIYARSPFCLKKLSSRHHYSESRRLGTFRTTWGWNKAAMTFRPQTESLHCFRFLLFCVF